MKAVIQLPVVICCAITASLALPWPIDTRKSKLAEAEEKLM
jgi:hypothetical protein